MGAVIPMFVLVLFKVSGHLFKRGWRRAGLVPGSVGTALLFLSVWDCQTSIELLMHTPQPWLSWTFAIGIDCGLVACEIAALIDE